jgi:hypothetical protein
LNTSPAIPFVVNVVFVVAPLHFPPLKHVEILTHGPAPQPRTKPQTAAPL